MMMMIDDDDDDVSCIPVRYSSWISES